jgi:hypothetical protein
MSPSRAVLRSLALAVPLLLAAPARAQYIEPGPTSGATCGPVTEVLSNASLSWVPAWRSWLSVRPNLTRTPQWGLRGSQGVVTRRLLQSSLLRAPRP